MSNQIEYYRNGKYWYYIDVLMKKHYMIETEEVTEQEWDQEIKKQERDGKAKEQKRQYIRDILKLFAWIIVLPWVLVCLSLYIAIIPMTLMMLLGFPAIWACSILSHNSVNLTRYYLDVVAQFLTFPLIGIPVLNDLVYKKWWA